MNTRQDTIWQDATVAASYGASRSAIPFVDVHFQIMHRILNETGLEVKNLLDLGAGDGIATVEVVRYQPVKKITLTDFSEPFMQAAKERFANSDLDAAFVSGDFRESDWHPEVEARGPFDMVVSRFAIHHIPDEMKKSLYGKVLEWLNPGGIFVNIEHTSSATPLYNAAYDRMMVEHLVTARGDEADFEEVFASYRARADGGANILAPVWDQVEWLRDIGFADVDCAFKCFELAVFAGRRPE